jgi:AraC-like DNA-binding protein
MWKSSFFRKSLLLIIALTTLPTALAGLFIHAFGTFHIERELNRSHQTAMNSVIERIDGQLNHLEMVAMLWAYNSSFSSPLQQLDIYQDPKMVQELYKSLTIIKSSDPLIEEAYVFLEKDDAVISDTFGIERPAETTLAAYRQLLHTPYNIFWSDSLPPGNLKNASPYSLVVRLAKGTVKSNIVMVFRIKADLLHKIIADAEPDALGATLLLKEDAQIISAGRNPADKPSPVDLGIRDMIRNSNTPRDSFVTTENGKRYSVSYREIKRIQERWIVATATPLANVTKPVILISRYILGISLAMLLIGLWLSWMASRRMYTPIQQLVHVFSSDKKSDDTVNEFELIVDQWTHVLLERKKLQQRLQSQLPTLREGFILQLAQGHLYALKNEEIVERLEKYGCQARDKKWLLLVIGLHGLAAVGSKFSQEDEQLATFAAANIAKEFMQGWPEGIDVINFQNLNVGILLPARAAQSVHEQKAELFRMAEELAATMHHFLRVKVTIGISKVVQTAGEIPDAMEETLQALKHRQAHEVLQVLDIEELLPHGSHETPYPFEEEKHLIHALRMGVAKEEADQLMDVFLERLQERAATELQIRQGLYQLFGSIQQAIAHSGFNLLQLYGGLMNEQLVALREPAAIMEWLKKDVVPPFLAELAQTQKLYLKELVDSVLNTIHRDYMKDLSLDSCADLHGTYPRKLSVGFKQVTGFTFIDYLTNYRLDKAKDLLLTTNVKINDVAEQVGYQPAYFHRIFKKHTGVTPGQYREQA